MSEERRVTQTDRGASETWRTGLTIVLAAFGLALTPSPVAAQDDDAIAFDQDGGGLAPLQEGALASLVASLRVEARHDRVRALHELVTYFTEGDVPALLGVLEDPAVSVRIQWRLLRALGMRNVQEAGPVAAAIVTDPERVEGVRQAAAYTIADLRAKAHAQALLDAARNAPEPLTRIIAAGAFYRVMGKGALHDLNRLLASETDPYAREHLDWFTQLIRNGDTFSTRPRPGEVVACAQSGTRYLVYAPTDYGQGAHHDLLISVHGTFGSADRYMEIVRERADRENVMVVAPWFDAATFPSFDNLNLDNVGIGLPRSDLRLLEIVDALGAYASVNTEKLYLYGHSKGGQFVQRFVFAHPDRVARAAPCASGIYLAPAEETKGGYGEMFPYGAAPNPFAPDLATRTFEGLVAAPIVFFVGTQDPRMLDAHRFVRESQLRARKEGYIPRIEVRLLPEVGHDGSKTFPPAADFLFGE